jgi:hypothetical protein
MAGTPLAVGNILKARIVCINDKNKTAFNIKHWRVSAIVAGVPTIEDAAEAFSIGLGGRYANCMATNATFWAVGMSRIFPNPPTGEVWGTSGRTGGTATGDPLPSQTCGLVKLSSPFAGKTNRGRLYVPFPAEDDNDTGDLPSGGYIVNAAGLGSLMVGGVTLTIAGRTATYIGIIWHKASTSYTDLTTATARGKWATQRRRGMLGKFIPPPVP